jgi:hypothetical protein
MDVSRSGRIRKKSTKLADFESSTEIDLLSPIGTPNSIKKKAKDPNPHSSHMTMTTSQTVDLTSLN